MKLSRRLFLLPVLAAALGVVSQAPGAEEYQGTVDHVFDGRTLRVDHVRGGHIRVRLVDLETNGTAREGREVLSRLAAGKRVRISGMGWERGTLVGRVRVENRWLGDELIRLGLAHRSR